MNRDAGFSVIVMYDDVDSGVMCNISHRGNYKTRMEAIGKAFFSLSDISTDASNCSISTYREDDGTNGIIHLLYKNDDGTSKKVATAYILPYQQYKGENDIALSAI